MLKRCQFDVKSMSKRCQNDVKSMSSRCQNDVKSMSKRCQIDVKTMTELSKKPSRLILCFLRTAHQFLQKMVAWKSIVNQFMKDKHSNAAFVHQILHKRTTWKAILNQFRKEKHHSIVTFIPYILHKATLGKAY